MVILRNLLPHDVNVYTEEGVVTLPPSGYSLCVTREVGDILTTADVRGKPVNIHSGDVITSYRLTFKGGSIPLPPPRNDMFFIVSQRMARSLWRTHKRSDFLVPMTGPHEDPIRDENRKIVGVRGLKIV